MRQKMLSKLIGASDYHNRRIEQFLTNTYFFVVRINAKEYNVGGETRETVFTVRSGAQRFCVCVERVQLIYGCLKQATLNLPAQSI